MHPFISTGDSFGINFHIYSAKLLPHLGGSVGSTLVLIKSSTFFITRATSAFQGRRSIDI